MHVGVLGGGLQGCCVALALAEKGTRVTLFDRNSLLLTRAAVANEGKIHLGYMYANDTTGSTARMMVQGALAFGPFFERHLARPMERTSLSTPASYAVHRTSQRSREEVAGYMSRTHEIIREAASGRERAYFGLDLTPAPRRWSDAERDREFDSDSVTAVFDSPEVAINPVELAEAVRARVTDHPLIELRMDTEVIAVKEEQTAPHVVVRGKPGGDRFDHVVNALWDGRLAVDQTLGLRPSRQWLHRLKYGVSFKLPENVPRPGSATFVSGPFGEVVSYPDRTTYLTWYPECLQGISTELRPPDWATYPDEPLRTRILVGTLSAMGGMVHRLAKVEQSQLTDVTVKGGVIVAWGETDIYDPASGLHKRYEIGVTSRDRYHSIDPGKLTMAPYFAQVCADRLLKGLG